MSDEKINKFLEELAISTMWADDFASYQSRSQLKK